RGHGPDEIEPASCPGWLRERLTASADTETATKPDPETRPAEPLSLSPCLHERRFVDIEGKPVDWLWPGWVPLGKLTLLDGDPGLGKSTLLLDLAARVSCQGLMPDGASGVRGQVVILSAEDGAEDTIRPRLDAAGALLNRVH